MLREDNVSFAELGFTKLDSLFYKKAQNTLLNTLYFGKDTEEHASNSINNTTQNPPSQKITQQKE